MTDIDCKQVDTEQLSDLSKVELSLTNLVEYAETVKRLSESTEDLVRYGERPVEPCKSAIAETRPTTNRFDESGLKIENISDLLSNIRDNLQNIRSVVK